MNKKIIPTILASAILFTACSSSTNTTEVADSVSDTISSTTEESVESSSESTTEATTETTLETTEATEATTTSETEAPVYDYVHSDDGYFNLVDAGYGTEVKAQDAGTCWVVAASISMESTYLCLNGEKITIDPIEILESVWDVNKEEGYYMVSKVPATMMNLGGWSWLVAERLSNGFGEYTLVEALDFNYTDMQGVKDAIKKYGGMVVSINDNDPTLLDTFGEYTTLNNPKEDFDHAVVIVGWDDNFPKEYFKKEASQDGAWIIQNTRGTHWGTGGYYWVSYDMPFPEHMTFILSDEYDHVLYYDGGNETEVSLGDTTTTANVFHEAGILKAIGTDTAQWGQDIHIEIRDVNMETVIYEQDAHFEANGYHVVALDQEVEVPDDYSIVITYTGPASVEGESWEDSDMYYLAKINPGESFILVDGQWVDMSSENIKDVLGIDFTPNNCCIKALY